MLTKGNFDFLTSKITNQINSLYRRLFNLCTIYFEDVFCEPMTYIETQTKNSDFLQEDYLQNILNRYKEDFINAKPFPHVMIDNFFPEDILNDVLADFPDLQKIDSQKFNNAYEKKLASTHERQMGNATRNLLYRLNSSTFISFLEELTGIDGIIPDPHFEGGGLHQIERGGYLKIHVDFNKNRRLKIDRRLNVLVYLNKYWTEEYGGHLQLWDREMTRCVHKILPIFNRMVIFNTNDFSYHGHPDPLTCPEGVSRRSLALYYYSNGRPADELSGENHSTIFKARADENIIPDREPFRLKSFLVNRIAPPILVDMFRSK
jgi:Rps23 Pro-64 3,4-dihydroxylase Tpa1-like proline 4-hydroxylase